MCANGHKDAVTEPESVRALFAAAPGAWGIGARMGAAAGLFAIDADLYKPGEAGASAKAFIERLSTLNILPLTRTHKTVNGGVHYIYSSDTAWPNCAPAPGVEVKGEGGYIVVPPTPGYSVTRAGVVAAPEALQQMLQQSRQSARDTSTDALKAQILSGDSFHEAAAQLSAKLAAGGAPVESIQKTLNDVFAASVAANPAHPRHDRWAQVVENKGGELVRLSTSAASKFNPITVSDRLREAAERAGLVSTFAIPANVDESLVPMVLPSSFTDWPFDGYAGTDELNILNQKFVAYPILAETETAIISAAPKAGKTLIAQTIAMHIAAGSDIGPDIKVPERRPVLYFALESQVAIRRRLVAWRKSVDPNGTLLTAETFPFFVAERPLNLTNEGARKELAAKIAAADRMVQEKGFPPLGLVVFDTLTKLMPGGNQNQAEDTSAVFSVIDEIKLLGVTACNMFIHHDNRQGQTRGSTNIQAEPDILFGVSHDEDTDLMRLTIRMARSIDDDSTFYFRKVDTTLGKTPEGYEIKAPLAIPHDIAGPAYQEDSRLKKLMMEEEVLAAVAAKGVGGHFFLALHKELCDKFTVEKYPPGNATALGEKTQLYWEQMLPRTGRAIGNTMLQPNFVKTKRGARAEYRLESIIVKAIAPVDLGSSLQAGQR